MAIEVKVTRGQDGFQVRWARGLVTVRTQKHAEALRANIARVGAASWARGWVMMPNPGKFASAGGTARAASMTAERRREIGQAGAAKRWGKTVAVTVPVEPVTVEEV
jgi:hypothetical protein